MDLLLLLSSWGATNLDELAYHLVEVVVPVMITNITNNKQNLGIEVGNAVDKFLQG